MAHCFIINFSLVQKLTLNNVQNRRVLVYFFLWVDCASLISGSHMHGDLKLSELGNF